MQTDKNMRFSAFFLLFLIIPSMLVSQGSFQGSVSDATSKEMLIGANIFFKGTAIGAITDIEGKFRIVNIPEGSYIVRISYLGYKAVEVPIDIVADRTATWNNSLMPDVIEGQEVIITAQARGQNAAINQQLTSNTIVNVVSEEKIKELPDANAAEAIGRLPGVSLLRSGGEANKVILRGMSDKFSTVTIDGVRIPPTDANARGIDLSAISQGSLAGVELFKALTSDKDADAIAGSINLVTRKAPAVPYVTADVKGNYNTLMNSANQYDFSFRYGERFFENVFGVQLTANLEQKIRSKERVNIDYSSISNNTDYVISDLELEFTDEIRKRNNFSVLLDITTPDSGSIRLNNTFNSTNRDYTIFNRNYPAAGSSNQQVLYQAQTIEQEIDLFNSAIRGENFLFDFTVTWGASFAQSLSESPFDYYIDFLEPSYLNPTTGEVISGMKPRPQIKTNPEQLIDYALNNFAAAVCSTAFFNSDKNLDKEKTAYLDVSRKYFVGDAMMGEFKFGGKYKVKDRLKETSRSYAPYYLGYFQEYTKLDNGTIVRKNLYSTRFHSFFTSFDTSNGQFRIPSSIHFLDKVPASRNLYDVYRLAPIVNRDAIREWYDLNKNGVDVNGNPEYFDDPTIDAEFYNISEAISAGYLMNTLTYGQDITFIAGVRVEKEENTYASKFSPQSIGGFPVPQGTIKDTSASYSETVVLPNFHLTLRPLDFINIRLAAYKALARPDFNYRLEKFVGSGGGGTVTLLLGNPKLKTAKAWNFELNTSFYSNTIGLISLSSFYKEIDDMYHFLNGASITGNVLMDSLGIAWRTPHTGAYAISLPYNSHKPTKVWGFEFEHQINLSFLPGYFQFFILSYNASVVRSETYLISTANAVRYDSVDIGGGIYIKIPINYNVIVENKQKLEGQPEFYGNISLGYDLEGFSARLSVFHQADYNNSFTASGRGDVVNNAFTRVDLSVKQRITENISLLFNISNLTGTDESNSVIDRVINSRRPNVKELYDMTADVGVRLEF